MLCGAAALAFGLSVGLVIGGKGVVGLDGGCILRRRIAGAAVELLGEMLDGGIGQQIGDFADGIDPLRSRRLASSIFMSVKYRIMVVPVTLRNSVLMQVGLRRVCRQTSSMEMRR